MLLNCVAYALVLEIKSYRKHVFHYSGIITNILALSGSEFNVSLTVVLFLNLSLPGSITEIDM